MYKLLETIYIFIIIIMRGFERKCTLKKLREICVIYHFFFFVKLNSVVSQKKKKKRKEKNLNSVVKEGLGAGCNIARPRFPCS